MKRMSDLWNWVTRLFRIGRSPSARIIEIIISKATVDEIRGTQITNEFPMSDVNDLVGRKFNLEVAFTRDVDKQQWKVDYTFKPTQESYYLILTEKINPPSEEEDNEGVLQQVPTETDEGSNLPGSEVRGVRSSEDMPVSKDASIGEGKEEDTDSRGSTGSGGG